MTWLSESMLPYSRRLSLSFVLIISIAALPAAADSSPVLVSDKLYEIPLEDLLSIPIRSASMLHETAWLAASSVTQVSSGEWQKKGARRYSDAVEHLPGVLVLPFRFGANALAIRGFAGSNLPRGTSLMLDGVPLTGFSNGAALVTVPNFDLGVLQNIELVRGPASALHGSDAFLGVLALNTESGSEFKQGSEAEFASSGYFQMSARLREQLDSNKLHSNKHVAAGFALSGQNDQARAYRFTDPESQELAQGFRHHEYESQSGFLKFVTRESDDLSFNLGFYWHLFSADNFPGPGRSQTPGRSALRDQDWSGSDTDFLMLNSSLAKKILPEVVAELKTFVWRADVEQETRVPLAGGSGENQVDTGDLRRGAQILLRSESQQNAGQSERNTDWALALGHDYMEVHHGRIRAFSADGILLSDADSRFKGAARYVQSVQAEIKTDVFADTLRFVYGGRIDKYEDFGTQPMPRLGMIYQITPQWLVKLLYGKAFRAPTAIELQGIGNFRGNPALDPEIIDTLEWVNTAQIRGATVSLTFFYSKWRETIVRVPVVDPVYRLSYENSGENIARGLEWTYHFEAKRWLFDANAIYSKSENPTRNEEFAAFPRKMINLGLGYSYADFTAWLNNRLLLDMAEGAGDGASARSLPRYWRVDLNLERQIDSELELFLQFRNIFNRDNALPSLFNAEGGIPDEELSVSFGYRYRF